MREISKEELFDQYREKVDGMGKKILELERKVDGLIYDAGNLSSDTKIDTNIKDECISISDIEIRADKNATIIHWKQGDNKIIRSIKCYELLRGAAGDLLMDEFYGEIIITSSFGTTGCRVHWRMKGESEIHDEYLHDVICKYVQNTEHRKNTL